MNMKFKVTNNGPSQYQIVDITVGPEDTVEDIEKKLQESLQSNQWTTEESANQEYHLEAFNHV